MLSGAFRGEPISKFSFTQFTYNLLFIVYRQYQGISVRRWRRDFFVSQAKNPQEYFVYFKDLRRRMAEKIKSAVCCKLHGVVAN